MIVEIYDRMETLTQWAESRTSCLRKGVGCEVVRILNGAMKIIGRRHNDAFNKDCTYCVNEPGKCCGIHAEQSILWKMNELGFRKDEKDGCFIMLVSYSPCTTCANWILMSGLIDAVVYETLTEHDQRGVQLLRHHGVDVLDFNQIKMALDFGSNKALLNSEAREAVCDYARKWEEISRVG